MDAGIESRDDAPMSIVEAVKAVTPNWKQARYAAVLGTDQGTVSRLLREDGRRFTFEQLALVEDAADVPRGTILALAGYVDPSVAELARSARRAAVAADEVLSEARRVARERRRGAARSGPSEPEPPRA